MACKLKETPDYTTLSGAEFQREVGVDPEKWAEAFIQVALSGVRTNTDGSRVIYISKMGEMSNPDERVAYIAGWFSDAMNAARKDWRQTVMGLEGE